MATLSSATLAEMASARPFTWPVTWQRILLIVPVVLVALFGIGAYRDVIRYRQATDQVEHNYQLLYGAETLLSLLKDAETGQRGYLLTGQEAFLEPYRTAVREVPLLEDRLRILTQDNSLQQEQFEKVGALRKRKLSEIQQTIELFQQGNRQGAVARVEGGEGRRIMDEIRRVLTDLEATERMMLTERSREANQQGEQTRLVLALGSISLLTLLIGAAGVIERDSRKRQRVTEALRESEARFRQAIDSMPQLVWSTLPDGYHDLYNKQWFDYTGLSYEATKGAGWNAVFHPDDQPRTWARWRHSLETGEPYEIEYRCRRYDGQHRWFLGRASAIRDEAGGITRWFGTCTDIHEQKEAEAALRLANLDLESFAFAAAHDLQEPLRMITSYAQLLSRRLGTGLDEDAKEFLRHIVGGAKQTSTLLTDLLAYTEVSRGEEEAVQQTVSLDALLAQAIQNLRTAISESGANISADPLPNVSGQDSHFLQLFQNLLGNAIKYRSEKTPDIHVTAKKNGMDWIISVKDNGLGIPEQYQKEVFGVFKRLHGKQIPGTGVGLAICQRVVERRGGAIWVESEGSGRGSIFRFSLPVIGANHG